MDQSLMPRMKFLALADFDSTSHGHLSGSTEPLSRAVV